MINTEQRFNHANFFYRRKYINDITSSYVNVLYFLFKFCKEITCIDDDYCVFSRKDYTSILLFLQKKILFAYKKYVHI